ncbi:hypothetical protein PITCH_A220014 [uncultured Desulfobacterium sp.]|uniref:Uncharacterized protein n=1 Tax=uncultured Desulfobacterium sp. TaxID=201089 RepID=A0A445MXN8_9BACT|nr:hypothetical protein PITCH_A220014 [uncultured Desulfobacterium sp.]
MYIRKIGLCKVIDYNSMINIYFAAGKKIYIGKNSLADEHHAARELSAIGQDNGCYCRSSADQNIKRFSMMIKVVKTR